MNAKKKLTPNQQALEVIAQLIQKVNGAGMFKELRDLDIVRASYTHIYNEISSRSNRQY